MTSGTRPGRAEPRRMTSCPRPRTGRGSWSLGRRALGESLSAWCSSSPSPPSSSTSLTPPGKEGDGRLDDCWCEQTLFGSDFVYSGNLLQTDSEMPSGIPITTQTPKTTILSNVSICSYSVIQWRPACPGQTTKLNKLIWPSTSFSWSTFLSGSRKVIIFVSVRQFLSSVYRCIWQVLVHVGALLLCGLLHHPSLICLHLSWPHLDRWPIIRCQPGLKCCHCQVWGSWELSAWWLSPTFSSISTFSRPAPASGHHALNNEYVGGQLE